MESPSPSSSTSVSQWNRDLLDPAKRDQVVAEIFHFFAADIEAWIARYIGATFRGRISEESVTQSAFLSFAAGQAAGRIEIHDRKGLLALLRQIAKNKVASRIRRETAQRRSPEGARPDDAAAVSESDKGFRASDDAPAAVQLDGQDEPGRGKKVLYSDEIPHRRYRVSHPISKDIQSSSYYGRPPIDLLVFEPMDAEITAMAHEAFEHTDEDLRATLELYIEGYTNDEIANRLGTTPAAVRRDLDAIQEQWLAYFQFEESSR